MAYTVPAAQSFGEQAYTITGVIQLMSSTTPPTEIAFPRFPDSQFAIEREYQGQGASIAQGPDDRAVVAAGLQSCAAVCYVNTQSTTGYVYHSPMGDISQASFQQAMSAIQAVGPPYTTVYVAYAHRDATDQGYQSGIASLVNLGVPTNNIVEITNLVLGEFGLNNLFQLGY